jgi:GNAT superfamily N-acetyltransferase
MTVTIRTAAAADAPALNAALARLSADLGDAHRADTADLVAAGWGENPAFRAQLALSGAQTVGIALYSPLFSTVRGGAGIYVSDLWVAPGKRSGGLGRQLLAAALADGRDRWAARFIKLAVYDGSPDARRFYDRLGFAPLAGLSDLILDEAACTALKGTE